MSERTCQRPGCGNPIRSSGLDAGHLDDDQKGDAGHASWPETPAAPRTAVELSAPGDVAEVTGTLGDYEVRITLLDRAKD